MFGYIKIHKEELKICEYEAYRAVYGALCNQLQKDYGLLARFVLSYDATFAAVLRMSVFESKATVKQARCPLNPLAKCNRVIGDIEELRYAAALSVIMTYYKCKDNLADENIFHKIPAWLALSVVRIWNKRADKRFPEAGECIANYMNEQSKEEQLQHGSFDRYCHPTATVLARLFASDMITDDDRVAMERIGYHVGKWVYMMDALDDYQTDIKRKRFNPILARLGQPNDLKVVCDFIEWQANLCLDAACEAYDHMNRQTFSPIIRNIFVLGLPQVQNEIIRKVMKQ